MRRRVLVSVATRLAMSAERPWYPHNVVRKPGMLLFVIDNHLFAVGDGGTVLHQKLP